MVFLLVILAFVTAIAFVNVLALVEGRTGNTSAHKAMLAAGIIGLLSLFVMIVSAFLLGAMLIVATLNSPQGHAFKLSATICAISTLVSLVLYVAFRRQTL